VTRYSLASAVHWALRFSEANEFSSNDSSLVHELVKTVLTICARLAENQRTCVHTLVKSYAFLGDTLAVALHVELLYVSWKTQ